MPCRDEGSTGIGFQTAENVSTSGACRQGTHDLSRLCTSPPRTHVQREKTTKRSSNYLKTVYFLEAKPSVSGSSYGISYGETAFDLCGRQRLI